MKAYIKFDINWENQAIEIKSTTLDELNLVRNELKARGYLGVLANGIGYGNLSVRYGNNILITGSATGGSEKLQSNQFAIISSYTISQNKLTCIGQSKASAESLSHAAIYEKCPKVNAVIHIHNKTLWNKYIHHLPTSAISAEYGTPKMAESIMNIVNSSEPNGIVIMGGHEDGILIYSEDMKRAMSLINHLTQKFSN